MRRTVFVLLLAAILLAGCAGQPTGPAPLPPEEPPAAPSGVPQEPPAEPPQPAPEEPAQAMPTNLSAAFGYGQGLECSLDGDGESATLAIEGSKFSVVFHSTEEFSGLSGFAYNGSAYFTWAPGKALAYSGEDISRMEAELNISAGDAGLYGIERLEDAYGNYSITCGPASFTARDFLPPGANITHFEELFPQFGEAT